MPHRRVKREKIALVAGLAEAVGARIGPDIRPGPSEPSQLDVVAVPGPALAPDAEQLMLTAIKRTHAGICLGPDAQVDLFLVDAARCQAELMKMAPIHRPIMQRPVPGKRRRVAHRPFEKGDELGFTHFTRPLDERPMANPAKSTHMPVDRNIEWWVGYADVGAFLIHQCSIGRQLQRIAAEQAMLAQMPEFTFCHDGRTALRHSSSRSCSSSGVINMRSISATEKPVSSMSKSRSASASSSRIEARLSRFQLLRS